MGIYSVAMFQKSPETSTVSRDLFFSAFADPVPAALRKPFRLLYLQASGDPCGHLLPAGAAWLARPGAYAIAPGGALPCAGPDNLCGNQKDRPGETALACPFVRPEISPAPPP